MQERIETGYQILAMDVMNRRTPRDLHTDNGSRGGWWGNLK